MFRFYRRWRNRKKIAAFKEAFIVHASTVLLMTKIKEDLRAEDIASRLGKDEWWVHERLSRPDDLNDMSDLAFAMNHMLQPFLIERDKT